MSYSEGMTLSRPSTIQRIAMGVAPIPIPLLPTTYFRIGPFYVYIYVLRIFLNSIHRNNSNKEAIIK